MRAVFLILIVAVVALIIAIQTGFMNITQTRAAKSPEVVAGSGGVSASGGQTPAFDVETGSVAIGSRDAAVAVPKLKIEPGNAKVALPTLEVSRPDEPAKAPPPPTATTNAVVPAGR